MRSYICYVHTVSSMTPHMRTLDALDNDDFITNMGEVLKEWPVFELVDVYDLSDELVLRMNRSGQARFS